jgi:hypothetical protein
MVGASSKGGAVQYRSKGTVPFDSDSCFRFDRQPAIAGLALCEEPDIAVMGNRQDPFHGIVKDIQVIRVGIPNVKKVAVQV